MLNFDAYKEVKSWKKPIHFSKVSDFSNTKTNYPMSGLYNVYNTNAVLLLLETLSISRLNRMQTNKWLSEFIPAFGRQEEIIYKNRKIFILLSKMTTGMVKTQPQKIAKPLAKL